MNIDKKLANRKRKISKKLKKRNWTQQPHPMFKASNIHYEFDGRHQGISYGGIGLIHLLAQKTGLFKEIDKNLELLKRHLPYHESDHVANMAYNILAGGTCLEDIELLRKNPAWLDALGAQIIPDPTTAGDFLRRFEEQDVLDFMSTKNNIRKKIWGKQPTSFKKMAIINIDGTISETYGQCKQGMDISYNGKWGYAPLIISLAGTREVLYVVNRSGNAPSHLDSAKWLDKTLNLVSDSFEKVYIRGDTDFSLTSNFGKWDNRCRFVFGMDARNNFVKLAGQIPESEWELLQKESRKIKTQPRKKPENVKAQVVERRKFKNLKTECEHVAEFEYRPGKCQKPYRMIVLRKTIKMLKGQCQLFDDVRYFFYITNDDKKSVEQLIQFYRNRADHENDIEQLKNGVSALNNPSDSLISNWVYMAIASQSWDLKAWYGLLLPYRALGRSIVRMEFKKFIHTFIQIPCLIIKSGRKITYRLVGYNDQVKHIFNLLDRMRHFAFP
ncbi:IS1380 family transposase [Desulfotignum balticum]|uniref:IS1380 family transposase n=1 Tax=Desulfotignum balticum TaxID=115781 RepID=UPI0004063B46|nr:IS1380 family transposase [Desulfotignum balticum]